MKSRDTNPTLTPALLEAVDLALGGDWQGAHLIAQEHEEDEIAKLREKTSAGAELREIRAVLTG